MPETRSGERTEIEQLRQEIAELQSLLMDRGDVFRIPDPIKQLSEFSGNKKELNAWLAEVSELYDEFKVKGERGQPDTFSAHYFRAIKNKLKGEARAVVCAHGNPSTITQLQNILRENFGDKRDLATNLHSLFHIRKGDRSSQKFYTDIKELNTRLRSNLQLHPVSTTQLLEIITITKFLDGVGEPLASIIRNSKPKTLEDAFQGVVINQNAEARRPAFKPKPHITPPANTASSANKFVTKPSATVYRRPFKPRAEANNTEETEPAEEDVEEEEEEEEEIEVGSDCDELNFHQVPVKNKKT